MNNVSFTSYISVTMNIEYSSYPMIGHFLQWGNSFILEEQTKIPMTVGIVRTKKGELYLANPLGIKFLDGLGQ